MHEPPPDLIDGEENYEVETILNHRRRGRGHQYLRQMERLSDHRSIVGTGIFLQRRRRLVGNL